MMTCIYNGWDGICDLWTEVGIVFEHVINSCDSDGYCLVDEDADPLESCKDYTEGGYQ